MNKSGLLNNAVSSLLSGILIGTAGWAYISCDNKYIGTLLFSLGLITIVTLKSNLYTGKIGYVSGLSDLPWLLVMCVCNIIGAAAVGFMAYEKSDAARAIAESKLDKSLAHWFIYAVMCGVMIYLAVELYARSKNYITVILPIMVFILSGFEHCIANVFYVVCARQFTLEAAAFVAVCIAGNSAGSVILNIMVKAVCPRKAET